MLIQLSISEKLLIENSDILSWFAAGQECENLLDLPLDPVQLFWRVFDQSFSCEKDYRLVSCEEYSDLDICWPEEASDPLIREFRTWDILLSSPISIGVSDLESDIKCLMDFNVGEVSMVLGS